MALKLSDLQFFYSNVTASDNPIGDPDTGLGGSISTHTNKRIKSQNATTITIAGITFVDAYGNPEGNGSLAYTHNGGTGRQVSWRPAGQATYYGVVVDAGGTFLIGSSSGYMEVTVVAGSLPVSDQLQSITISNNLHAIFPQVAATDSLLGITEYRCVYIKNISATDAAPDCKLWVASNTPGGDTVDIGLGTSGLNGIEQVIADGETAPVGVTFSAPSTSGTGLVVGNIPLGQHYAFWMRRTVPVETRGTVISNGVVLGLSATI